MPLSLGGQKQCTLWGAGKETGALPLLSALLDQDTDIVSPLTSNIVNLKATCFCNELTYFHTDKVHPVKECQFSVFADWEQYTTDLVYRCMQSKVLQC